MTLLMMINNDDDIYTLHIRGQSTCEDYIPLARRREKKINSFGPELKEKKEKEERDER